MDNEERQLHTVAPEDLLDVCDFAEEFQGELGKHKARLTGTPEETAVARLIRDRLHEETDAKVRLEAYHARPFEGRGCFILFGLWYALCLVIYLISFVGGRVAGVLLTLFTLLLLCGGGAVFGLLFLGKGGKLRILLPKKVSYNVVSERSPSVRERGKERTVVICDNHDSLYGGYFENFGLGRKVVMIAAPVSLGIFVLFCILKMAVGSDTVAKITAFTIIPFLSTLAGLFVILTHFSPFPKHARENNGVATCAALAAYAYFVENPEYLPDDVKLVYASFGGENSAHGGSEAFVAAHPELADASVICVGDIINSDFALTPGDALRNLTSSKRVMAALVDSASVQNIPLHVADYSDKKQKFNCLHGFISNAFAKSNIPSATVLAKDYNAGEEVVGREGVERLFSLVVTAASALMEDDSRDNGK